MWLRQSIFPFRRKYLRDKFGPSYGRCREARRNSIWEIIYCKLGASSIKQMFILKKQKWSQFSFMDPMLSKLVCIHFLMSAVKLES
jgi:hypothetical protein